MVTSWMSLCLRSAFAWDARVLTTDSTTFGKNVGAQGLIRSGSPVSSIVWLFTVIALQASTLYEKPVSTRPHERDRMPFLDVDKYCSAGGTALAVATSSRSCGGHVEPGSQNPVCISAATTSLSLVYTSVPHSWRERTWRAGGRTMRRGEGGSGGATDGAVGRARGGVCSRTSFERFARLVRAGEPAGGFFPRARDNSLARDRRLGGK